MLLLFVCVYILASEGLPVFAVDTASGAREIMEEVQRRSFSRTFRYEGHITVRKAKGATDQKTWRYERFGPPGNSKVMLRFLGPAEIRGVALLIWNHPGRNADMWLYTPAIARSRRIARQDRSSRFAGTGFSFEDLEEDDIGQWEYSDTRDAEENGEPCWRITARRRSDPRSAHDRNWIWISKTKMTPLRIDKFRDGRVKTRLTMRSLEQVEGIWTPLLMEAADLSDGSLTTLRLTGARYDSRMTESSFTLEALRGAW